MRKEGLSIHYERAHTKGYNPIVKKAMQSSRTTRPALDLLAGIFAAEETIARMSQADYAELLRNRQTQADDGFVRLWNGLCLDAQGEADEACEEFLAAGKLGCDHWRVGWALAQAARRAGRLELVDQACAAVLRAYPDFWLAREFPKHARGYYGKNDQDKIIEKFFRDQPAQNRIFVEVGAFDGVHHSNVRRLQEQHAWSGISIEPVERNFARLSESYRGRKCALHPGGGWRQ